MKIILIHGENTTAAGQKYFELIEKAKREGYKIQKLTKTEELGLASLFENKVLYTGRLNDFKKEDLDYFRRDKDINYDVLVWYEGLAPSASVKSFPKRTEIIRFDLPKIIFNFLDSFYPGNSVGVLGLLDRLLKIQPIEPVIFMLGRHLRDLYWVKNDHLILPNYEDWRIRKLTSQSARFTNVRLRRIINLLAEADCRSKASGGYLRELVDFVIVTQLK